MMFLPTTVVIIFEVLCHIIGTADGYSVAVAGLKPTKEIIERDCRDPTFVPSYCPKNITEPEEDDHTKKNIKLDCLGLPSDAEDCQTEAGDDYANSRRIRSNELSFLANRNLKSNKKRVSRKKRLRKVYTGEMEIDCLGLPSDAADCLTEAGEDYANNRKSGKKFKKSKKKRYRKKKRYGKKTSRQQKNVFVGEMEIECLGLPSDAKRCLTEAGNDYANTREIDTSNELQTKKKEKKKKEKKKKKKKKGKKGKQKEVKEMEEKKNGKKKEKKKEKKEKEEKIKEENEISRVGGEMGMFANEMEMECLGLFGSTRDPQHCMDTTTKDHEIKKNLDETKDFVREMNNLGEIRGEAETECIGEHSDPDYCHDYANGADYANGKGNAKAAIVLKDNKLYLQFGTKNKSTKKYKRLQKRKVEGTDFEVKNRIIGGLPTHPHEFPWIVRIIGGCAAGACAGSLISPRLILTSYHCTFHPNDKGDEPCDHGDEKRMAYLGRHEFNTSDLRTCDSWDRDPICDGYYGIPIIDVKYPENQGFSDEDSRTHDFAMLVLRDKAIFSPNIQPICLPKQDEDFGGKIAKAAGWGRTAKPDINKWQSPVLRSVDLAVSTKQYRNRQIFGTTLEKNSNDEFKDACSGDSGGPLMFFDPSKISNYTIIGTVMGEGYDCINDVETESEGSTNGLWNKVSAWVDWIRKEMEDMGEIEDEGCNEDEWKDVYN